MGTDTVYRAHVGRLCAACGAAPFLIAAIMLGVMAFLSSFNYSVPPTDSGSGGNFNDIKHLETERFDAMRMLRFRSGSETLTYDRQSVTTSFTDISMLYQVVDVYESAAVGQTLLTPERVAAILAFENNVKYLSGFPVANASAFNTSTAVSSPVEVRCQLKRRSGVTSEPRNITVCNESIYTFPDGFECVEPRTVAAGYAVGQPFLPISTRRTNASVGRSFFSFGLPLPCLANANLDEDGEIDPAFQSTNFSDWFGDAMMPFIEGEGRDALLAVGVDVLPWGNAPVRYWFNKIITGDLAYVGIAAVAVAVVLLVMSRSLLLTLAGVFHIIISYYSAWCVFLLFGYRVFPGLVQMVLFIILGIGADDIFVVLDAWKRSHHEGGSNINESLAIKMSVVISRAATAMFVTTFTTFAAFAATAASPVPAISAFGIYAAACVVIDYLYVVTWFPAILCIYHRFFEFRKLFPFEFSPFRCVFWELDVPDTLTYHPQYAASQLQKKEREEQERVRKGEGDEEMEAKTAVAPTGGSISGAVDRVVTKDGRPSSPSRDGGGGHVRVEDCDDVDDLIPRFAPPLRNARAVARDRSASPRPSSAAAGTPTPRVGGSPQYRTMPPGVHLADPAAPTTAVPSAPSPQRAGQGSATDSVSSTSSSKAAMATPAWIRWLDARFASLGWVGVAFAAAREEPYEVESLNVGTLSFAERAFHHYVFPFIRLMRMPILIAYASLLVVTAYYAVQLKPAGENKIGLPDDEPIARASRLLTSSFGSSNAFRAQEVCFVYGIQTDSPLDRGGVDPNAEDFVGVPVFNTSFSGSPKLLERVAGTCVRTVETAASFVRERGEVVAPPGTVPAVDLDVSTALVRDVPCLALSFIQWARGGRRLDPDASLDWRAWRDAVELPQPFKDLNTSQFAAAVEEFVQSPAGSPFTSAVGFERPVSNVSGVVPPPSRLTWLRDCYPVVMDPTTVADQDTIDMWEEFAEKERDLSATSFYDTSNMYVGVVSKASMRRSTIVSAFLSLVLVFIVMSLFSGSIPIALIVTACITQILVFVFAYMVWRGWPLDFIESVALTVLVGISVDFTVHYGVAYQESPYTHRQRRLRFAMTSMGTSITSGAVTTLSSAALLFAATFEFFTKFGEFMFITIGSSWIVANTLFPALVYYFGPTGHCCDIHYGCGVLVRAAACGCEGKPRRVDPEVDRASPGASPRRSEAYEVSPRRAGSPRVSGVLFEDV